MESILLFTAGFALHQAVTKPLILVSIYDRIKEFKAEFNQAMQDSRSKTQANTNSINVEDE